MVVLKVNPNGRSQSEPHMSLTPASMSFMYERKLASLLPEHAIRCLACFSVPMVEELAVRDLYHHSIERASLEVDAPLQRAQPRCHP